MNADLGNSPPKLSRKTQQEQRISEHSDGEKIQVKCERKNILQKKLTKRKVKCIINLKGRRERESENDDSEKLANLLQSQSKVDGTVEISLKLYKTEH